MRVCKKSAPGSVREARPEMHECWCTRDQAWVWVCKSVIFTLFSRELLVCVYMYMHVNIGERLRLRKAVNLLLIKNYFVLKIVS